MQGPAPSAVLDVDLMRSFIAISETGGVSSAAHRVGRTPAAISMQLKKLEEILGVSLFDRTSRGMTLNKDGERLIGHARRMLRLNQEALAAFRGPALTGDVRVGLIDDFGGTRLSEVLAAFARTHPDVTVTVVMGATEMLHRKFLAQELDVTVLTPGCAAPWRTPIGLSMKRPLVWAGAAGGCAVEIKPLPVALAASGCAWRKNAMEALDSVGLHYRVAYTTEYYEAQKAAVTADLAIAPLPCSLVKPPFEVLGPKHGLPKLGVCRIAVRVGKTAGPAAQALADRITESYVPEKPRSRPERAFS